MEPGSGSDKHGGYFPLYLLKPWVHLFVARAALFSWTEPRERCVCVQSVLSWQSVLFQVVLLQPLRSKNGDVGAAVATKRRFCVAISPGKMGKGVVPTNTKKAASRDIHVLCSSCSRQLFPSYQQVNSHLSRRKKLARLHKSTIAVSPDPLPSSEGLASETSCQVHRYQKICGPYSSLRT